VARTRAADVSAETQEVHAEVYLGPDRRKSSEETRDGYLVERKLRMDMLNTLGRKAIIGVLVMGSFWVGRVETNISAAHDAQKTLAVLAKTVGDLASGLKETQEREREQTARRDAERGEVLVQLEKLNGQIMLMREEQQGRVVRGENR
jgi:hypothetical protein